VGNTDGLEIYAMLTRQPAVLSISLDHLYQKEKPTPSTSNHGQCCSSVGRGMINKEIELDNLHRGCQVVIPLVSRKT
jgi:hypothetical protein